MKDKLKSIILFLIITYKAIMYYPFIKTSFLYFCIFLILFLTFIDVFNMKYKKTTFYKIVILFLMSLLAIINTISVNLLFPILIVLIYYKNDKKEESIAMNFFWSLLFWFIITIVLNIIGILPSYNGYRYGEIRYSLGFQYPGFVGLYFLFISLSGYLAFRKEKKILIILLPFALLFYKLSLSRAGLVGFIALFVLALLPKKFTCNKRFKTIVLCMFPLLTILVVIFSFLYYKYNLEELNDVFSGRLLHYYMYINNGMLTKPIGITKLDDFVIDNYYLYFFYDYGFIGYIIWLIINHISIRRININSKLLIILFVIFIYGLFDSNAVVTSINFMISIQFLYLTKEKN